MMRARIRMMMATTAARISANFLFCHHICFLSFTDEFLNFCACQKQTKPIQKCFKRRNGKSNLG
jgi:hypothetical protein